MFADLDDPTPPTPDMSTRQRVDIRTDVVRERARRHRRRTRLGFLAVVAVFAVAVGVVAVVSRSSNSRPTAPVAPTGDVIATWPFVGQPSAADRQATVDRLNQRFTAANQPVAAWLRDDHVVITAAAGPSERPEVLTTLAQPGHLEFRPVLEAPSPLGHVTTPAPGSGQVLVPSTVDPTRRGPSNQYLLGPEVVDGSAIESVTTGPDPNGQWQVRPVLRAGPDGIDAFNALAASCFERAPSCPGPAGDPGALGPGYGGGGGQIAVVLDDQVLVAPTIQAADFDRDQITISGEFDQTMADLLAAIITSGVLPAPLDLTSS